MRLIDADKLLQELEQSFKEVGGECVDNLKRKHPEINVKQMRATMLADFQLVVDTIDEQTTVTCKNCKFYVENESDITGDECMGEWGDNPICCEFVSIYEEES